MHKRNSGWLTIALAVIVLTNGCALLGSSAAKDDALIRDVMAKYKAGMETADIDVVLPLLADDYIGPRDSSKEDTAAFFDRMQESEEHMELNLDAMLVAVDSEGATVTGVTGSFREWEWSAEYVLVKNDPGWQIQGVEIIN